jgi:thiol-disulfide isomerase/thioredoxin
LVNAQSLKSGVWSANLQLNETTLLPFDLEISGKRSKKRLTIHNAEEKIVLGDLKNVNDSFQVYFQNFHSFLQFKIDSKKDINGYWVNLNKGENYKIPFFAQLEKNKNDFENRTPLNLNGTWKTIFSPDSKDKSYAIGVFKSEKENNKRLTGTFLTETGDYRFLSGKAFNNKMSLSCFDGSHAFYFEADMKRDSLFGHFYSGSHYETNWIASKDDNFKLGDPDSLTYLVEETPFNFKVKDLAGKEFVFPQEKFKNKATIIQIMGTWCPNCLDETRFLKEMYAKYAKEGLQIISVCYETPIDFQGQVQKVNLLRDKLKLEHTFLIGGIANKALASEQFSMLNKIISYPTAIFIDKKGEVVKIHTGFNGPGTGEIYKNFVLETEIFIQNMLK